MVSKNQKKNILFLYPILWICSILIIKVETQQEILSITSFNECINLDFSARNATTGDGTTGQYLDCSNSDNPSVSVNVTVLDLELTANVDGNSEFIVDLVILPDYENRNRKNTNGSKCNADPSVPQNCIITAPTTIRILSTEYVFYYPLIQNTGLVAQYCYMMHTNILTAGDLSLNQKSRVNQGMVVGCMQDTVVKNCNPTYGGTLCAHDQGMFDPVADLSKGILKNGYSATNYWDAVPSSSDGGKCVRTEFSYDSIRKYGLSDDDRSVHPNPTLDKSKTNRTYVISDPEPMDLTFSSSKIYDSVLQSIMCSGFVCGIFNTYCYNYKPGADVYPEVPVYGGNLEPIGISFLLYQLRPLCYIFNINQVPSVAVKVVIEVDVESVGTETLTLSNIMGLERSSSDAKLIDARVISVDTLDGYIGPSLAGYISVCGGQQYQGPLSQKNPQGAWSSAPQDDLQVLPLFDMRNRTLFNSPINGYKFDTNNDITSNPWDTIRENVPSPSGLYYPNNRFLTFSTIWDTDPESYGKNSDPFSTGGDPYSVGMRLSTNVMWYYISYDKSDWLGKSCNQLGITDLFWNTNFKGSLPNRQTGVEQCYLDSYACGPGMTNATFGGRSIPGCLASAAFNAMITYTNISEIPGSNGLPNPNAPLIQEIVKASMPPYYDPTNPNYWIAPIESSGALFFKPNPSQAIAPVSFEILIDLVGTFVGYAETFPNGHIVNVSCDNATVGTQSVSLVTIQNVGLINGSYDVDIDCPIGSGVTLISGFPLEYPVLSPNETYTLPFTFISDGIPDSPQKSCEIFLRPSTSAFAILDSSLFTCDLSNNNIKPQPNDTDIPPDEPGVLGCSGCNFACFEEVGSITDAWCFWLIVIIPSVTILVSLVSGIYFCVYRSEKTKKSNEYTQKIDKINRQMDEYDKSKEPNRNDPPGKMDSQDMINMFNNTQGIPNSEPMLRSEIGRNPESDIPVSDTYGEKLI